eukprot:6393386-Amphidinium_carterae.3
MAHSLEEEGNVMLPTAHLKFNSHTNLVAGSWTSREHAFISLALPACAKVAEASKTPFMIAPRIVDAQACEPAQQGFSCSGSLVQDVVWENHSPIPQGWIRVWCAAAQPKVSVGAAGVLPQTCGLASCNDRLTRNEQVAESRKQEHGATITNSQHASKSRPKCNGLLWLLDEYTTYDEAEMFDS